jgi:hypothetical protein
MAKSTAEAQQRSNPLLLPVPLVAAFFDVTTATIGNWQKLGCPKVSKGCYNLKEIFVWWLEHIYKSKHETKGEKETRERFWAAKADNEELKRDHTKGKLILKDRVDQEFTERAADLRTTFRAYKYRLGPVLEGKSADEIMKILGDENDRILRNFCRLGRYIGDAATAEDKETKKAAKKPAKKAKKAPAKKAKSRKR